MALRKPIEPILALAKTGAWPMPRGYSCFLSFFVFLICDNDLPIIYLCVHASVIYVSH
jgi:hypothetical protein